MKCFTVLQTSRFGDDEEGKKKNKTLNGKTTFCSFSAPSEASVANTDLNHLRFVEHDHVVGKTGIVTYIK